MTRWGGSIVTSIEPRANVFNIDCTRDHLVYFISFMPLLRFKGWYPFQPFEFQLISRWIQRAFDTTSVTDGSNVCAASVAFIILCRHTLVESSRKRLATLLWMMPHHLHANAQYSAVWFWSLLYHNLIWFESSIADVDAWLGFLHRRVVLNATLG